MNRLPVRGLDDGEASGDAPLNDKGPFGGPETSRKSSHCPASHRRQGGRWISG
jgi:hypothetical protein